MLTDITFYKFMQNSLDSEYFLKLVNVSLQLNKEFP